MSAFPGLFSPLRVGSYTLANRIMNTGHAAHFQTGDGLPTQRYVDYVRERAKGGAGTGVSITPRRLWPSTLTMRGLTSGPQPEHEARDGA